jgi:hypothetical protein
MLSILTAARKGMRTGILPFFKKIENTLVEGGDDAHEHRVADLLGPAHRVNEKVLPGKTRFRFIWVT